MVYPTNIIQTMVHKKDFHLNLVSTFLGLIINIIK